MNYHLRFSRFIEVVNRSAKLVILQRIAKHIANKMMFYAF